MENKNRIQQPRERVHKPYGCIYSIRDHAQVGWYLKSYWLKERNVLPQKCRVAGRDVLPMKWLGNAHSQGFSEAYIKPHTACVSQTPSVPSVGKGTQG